MRTSQSAFVPFIIIFKALFLHYLQNQLIYWNHYHVFCLFLFNVEHNFFIIQKK